MVALNHTHSGPIVGADPKSVIPDAADLPFNPPAGLKVLRRITLIIDDLPPQHRLAALANAYDLLALRPTTERALQAATACTSADIVSLDLTQRFEKPFRRNALAQAHHAGVAIELCYGHALSTDSGVRRAVISNAAQLIRNSRNRGIILGCGMAGPAAARGPADVVNLAAVWGLGQEKGMEGIGRLARDTVVAATLKRKSWRGVVDIVHGGDNIKPAQTEKSVEAMSAGKGGQKRKADALGDVVMESKPLSKTQLKKQRRLQEQQKRADTNTK